MSTNPIRVSHLARWIWTLPAGLATLQIVVMIWAIAQGQLVPLAWLLAGIGFAALFLSLGVYYRHEQSLALARRTAARSLKETAVWVDELAARVLDDAPQVQDAEAADALAAAVGRLLAKVALARPAQPLDPRSLQDSRVIPIRRPGSSGTIPVLTRSGLYDSPMRFEGTTDPMASQEFTANTSDMIARLDPIGFRWIDSTPAEQQFLGWPLSELRRMSFLDVVHPEHRELAREQLRAAILKGEAHGLVYRIKTARGDAKAIEVSVSLRYAPDSTVDHLRCFITDVTERLRASRELRRRTRDLLNANGMLLQANRELQEVKDLYSDLYQNAPAMYFSLDEAGAFRECNETLLHTLGYTREQLIGQPYLTILPEWRRPSFAANFARFLACGRLEVESRWVKRNGEMIDVWVKATGVLDPEGKVVRSRSLAQDITERKALEAELQEQHATLMKVNEELERKNTELDDFSHAVSHDLQEPVRTLIAFSEILSREQADRLDETGREHVRYLVEASRRMRQLIRDVLVLSRAGRAAGDFATVDLDAVLRQIRDDFAATLGSSGGSLIVDSPLGTCWGDRGRIGQLLGNLISNAMKYRRTDVPPEVRVTARTDDQGATIVAVADNGIGIAPRYHDQIFQVFRRLHSGDEFEGTGAGLAICRKIVQAHDGRIWVESEVGEGATFFVSLPAEPSAVTTVHEAAAATSTARELLRSTDRTPR